jgi:hypothetical protein
LGIGEVGLRFVRFEHANALVRSVSLLCKHRLRAQLRPDRGALEMYDVCVLVYVYLHLTHVLLFVCSSIPLFLCFFLCLSFSRARSLTRSLSVAEGTAFEARRSAESAIARASVLYRDTPRRGQAVGLETSLSVIRKLEGWLECLCVGPAWEIQFSTR